MTAFAGSGSAAAQSQPSLRVEVNMRHIGINERADGQFVVTFDQQPGTVLDRAGIAEHLADFRPQHPVNFASASGHEHRMTVAE